MRPATSAPQFGSFFDDLGFIGVAFRSAAAHAGAAGRAQIDVPVPLPPPPQVGSALFVPATKTVRTASLKMPFPALSLGDTETSPMVTVPVLSQVPGAATVTVTGKDWPHALNVRLVGATDATASPEGVIDSVRVWLSGVLPMLHGFCLSQVLFSFTATSVTVTCFVAV